MVIGPAGQLAECRAKAWSWSGIIYYYYLTRKSSWNEPYSSSSFTKQSCSKMALYRWIKTESFLASKAVQSLRINQGPTVTFMWHAKSQVKPQTYSDSHCFVVKPQPTWRYWHCLKPVSTMWRWSSQKKKPAVPGCSNWISLELRLPGYMDE